MGRVTKNDLASSSNHWFNPSYRNYDLDTFTLDLIYKNKLLDGITFDVFFGSWCGDSHRHLPPFVKMTEYLNVPESDNRFMGLNEGKKSQEGFEDGKNITHVPTFIFYKNKKEIGRITESPSNSLEMDMLHILEQ